MSTANRFTRCCRRTGSHRCDEDGIQLSPEGALKRLLVLEGVKQTSGVVAVRFAQAVLICVRNYGMMMNERHGC
jgi:hypothetical protein